MASTRRGDRLMPSMLAPGNDAIMCREEFMKPIMEIRTSAM